MGDETSFDTFGKMHWKIGLIAQLRGSREAVHINDALVPSLFSQYTQRRALGDATEYCRHA